MECIQSKQFLNGKYVGAMNSSSAVPFSVANIESWKFSRSTASVVLQGASYKLYIAI